MEVPEEYGRFLNEEQLLALTETENQESLIEWLDIRHAPYIFSAIDTVITTTDKFREIPEDFIYEKPVKPEVTLNYIEPSRGKTKGCVYVIRMGEDGPLKIGFSSSEHQAYCRLQSLQTGNPYPLKMIYIGNASRPTETKVHRILKEHRMMGEWFEPEEPVFEFLDRVKEIGFFDTVLERK